jgi:hypothetical protein
LTALLALEAAAIAAPTPQDLCNLGAGPAENLLRFSGRGEELISDTEAIAARCAAFREALACLWTADDMPEGLRRRLRALGADSG